MVDQATVIDTQSLPKPHLDLELWRSLRVRANLAGSLFIRVRARDGVAVLFVPACCWSGRITVAGELRTCETHIQWIMGSSKEKDSDHQAAARQRRGDQIETQESTVDWGRGPCRRQDPV